MSEDEATIEMSEEEEETERGQDLLVLEKEESRDQNREEENFIKIERQEETETKENIILLTHVINSIFPTVIFRSAQES